MNDFYLHSPSGKNLTPRPLEQEASPKKKADTPSPAKASFQEVLKNVVAKTQSSTEVRNNMVEQYKNSLADGTYEVKSEELAEKMIQKIRDNKTRVII